MKAAVGALGYLEYLAGKTQTDIEDWDITAILKSESGIRNDIIVNKGAINDLFFTHKEKIAEGVEGFSEEIRAQVDAQVSALGGDKKYLQAEYNRFAGERDRWYSEYVAHHQRATAAARAIERIEKGQNPDLVGNLDKALRNQSFFRFKDFSGKHLRLYTVADTILTHKNPAAGIDTRVNMGTFEVWFHVSGLTPEIHPRKNNLFYKELFHPHVSRDGRICFGEAAVQAFKAQVEGDFTTLLALIAHLISHYSQEGHPYTPLESFTIGEREEEERDELRGG
jgi:hypothetical protein